jgi:hypothetical protein
MRAWSILTALARAVREAMTVFVGVSEEDFRICRRLTLFVLCRQNQRIVYHFGLLRILLHSFPLFIHLSDRFLARLLLPFLLRCPIDCRSVPSTSCHKVHTDHLRLARLHAVRELLEFQSQPGILSIDFHASIFILAALINTLIDRQRQLSTYGRSFQHACWVESQQYSCLIVRVQYLLMDCHMYTLRPCCRRCREPSQ